MDATRQLLQEAGDPEPDLFSMLGLGVEMAVEARLPRTPRVFRAKTWWRLPESVDPLASSEENYPSGDRYEAVFRRTL